jgi:hypothetical protein
MNFITTILSNGVYSWGKGYLVYSCEGMKYVSLQIGNRLFL